MSYNNLYILMLIYGKKERNYIINKGRLSWQSVVSFVVVYRVCRKVSKNCLATIIFQSWKTFLPRKIYAN